MKTKTLIQTQANVIKITSLTKGDVFKMIDSTYSTPEVKYGVVVDLMNDGDKTFIETLIYTKSYDDVKAEIKVIDGEKDISIYPCELDEMKEYFNQSLVSLRRKIEDKKEELKKLVDGTNKADEFINGELAKDLKEVEYKEITQSEFNNQRKAKEQKIAELSEGETF